MNNETLKFIIEKLKDKKSEEITVVKINRDILIVDLGFIGLCLIFFAIWLRKSPAPRERIRIINILSLLTKRGTSTRIPMCPKNIHR